LRFLFLFLFATSFLFSSDDGIASLLDNYNQEADRSHETLKDSAGVVTLYTREDLDRMQATTLNDILNTIRMFNLQPSYMGQTQINLSGSNSISVSPTKIFINDHELNNASFGNPIAQYGSMNLYFVDYIEIYQAENSISFGNESGGMIIKIYTKKPSRENGTFGQFSIDNKGSSTLNLLQAQMIDDRYSYLANVSLENHQSHHYKTTNNYTVDDKMKKMIAFFQFNKEDDYHIDISATRGEKNSFAGWSMTPKVNEMNGQNAYINVVKKLQNNFKLKLSSSIEMMNSSQNDYKHIILSDGTKAKNINLDFRTTSSNIILEKQNFFDDDHLFLALQAKVVTFKVTQFTADGIDKNTLNGTQSRTLLSLYGENTFTLNKSNAIITGLKFDQYFFNNKLSNDTDSLTYRLGLLSKNKKLKNKLFLFNRIVQPTSGQAVFSL